jgi:hypothetical protein
VIGAVSHLEIRHETVGGRHELGKFDSRPGVPIGEHFSECEFISRNADVSRDCHGIGSGESPVGVLP